MKKELKVGDIVTIKGCPITKSKYLNQEYKDAHMMKGKVEHIYAHGERNIIVRYGQYHQIGYYSGSDLTPTPKNRGRKQIEIMTAKEKAQQIVNDLHVMIDDRIFDDLPIAQDKKDIAHIARIGALQLAIVKIKGKFSI